MRLALVTDWFAPRRGGIETQLLGLAKELSAAGLTPTVVTSFPGPLVWEGVAVVRLDATLFPGAMVASPIGLVGRLQDAFAAGEFDLVHVHASVVAPVGLAALVAARNLGLPAAITFHSSMRLLPSFLHLLEKTMRLFSNVEICGVSEHIVAQAQRIFPNTKCRLLPNGHDHAFWSEADDTRDPQRFRLVTAMRLAGTKRPMALLDVLETMLQRARTGGPFIEMHIAGDGSFAPRLARVIRRRGLSDRVQLLGWQSSVQLRAQYASADVFLLPATAEAFGIAALEARAAGLPVAARAGNGVADYIRTPEDGYLGADDSALADYIVALRDNGVPAAYRGPRPALARYAWQRVGQDHVDLYAALLARQGAAPRGAKSRAC